MLLDTSFLTPFLGLATDEAMMESLPRLKEMELFYSELSILEAMWKTERWSWPSHSTRWSTETSWMAYSTASPCHEE